MPRIAPAVALAMLGSLAASPLARSQQQQQAPVFRAEANLVEVIVRVTDESGRFVPGLTPADFELRDEGRAQPIVAFHEMRRTDEEATVAPRPAPFATPDMSTVASNDTAETGGLFVLLLDDMLTSADYAIPVRTIARQFVEQFVGPHDLMAVFSTAGHGVINQEFTQDKARILQVVDRFLGGPCGGTDGEQVYRIRVATDVIAAVARHLAGVRGRRVSLLWVSEGIGYDVANGLSTSAPRLTVGGGVTSDLPAPAGNTMVAHAMQEALDALRRANVTVYAVDPRRLWAEGMTPGDPCEGSRRSVDVLRQFSRETGGFAAVDSNDLAPSFARVIAENREYYVLGFQPSQPGRPGELRRIDVRVPGRRVTVSARPAYVAGAAEPPAWRPTSMRPGLADAITNNLPVAALSMRAHAIPRPGSGPDGLIHVVVEIPGQSLQLTPDAADDQLHESIELALQIIDSLARPKGLRTSTLSLRVPQGSLPTLRAGGVRWITTITLPTGHYSLRAAAHGVTTKRTGSVFLDLDVPPFQDERLWIGGLAVTSKPTALGVTSGPPSDALQLPTPPTTARTFVQGDVITLSAGLTTPADFTAGAIRFTLRPAAAAASDPPLLDRTTELPTREAALQPRTWVINTAALPPGEFVLRLTLRDSGGREVDTGMAFQVLERTLPENVN